MKQRITLEDISALSPEQKQAVNDLWIPAMYDVAVAEVCTDVSEEKYESIEFVIGGIQFYQRTKMLLHDIKYAENGTDSEPEASFPPAQQTDDTETENTDEEFDEDSSDFSYSRPSSFNKEDCLPLLTVGHMIDILNRKGFGYGDFYLAVGINEVGCEIGKSYFNIDNYGNAYEKAELCDVLFEYLKTMLE